MNSLAGTAGRYLLLATTFLNELLVKSVDASPSSWSSGWLWLQGVGEVGTVVALLWVLCTD